MTRLCLAFSRPRLKIKFSYFGDQDLDESQNPHYTRPRLFHYYDIFNSNIELKFLFGQICPGLLTFGDDKHSIELEEYVYAHE